MWTGNAQNPYTNSEHDAQFRDNHPLQNHHHYPHYHHNESLMSFEGTSSSNNGGFVSGFDQISDDHGFYLHPQGSSPIGLSLRKSDSLINLVEMTLSHEREQKKVESDDHQPIPEKLKASNFHALLLQIGSWKRVTKNEGDLVAKIYYSKKKLVWEFLDGPLKSKLEMQWSEISAIRSFLYEGDHGRLEIELNQPPLYCRETNPQPRKHTQWKQTTDFTGGQASICRVHSVIFPPGVLDKQYEKLLQCDNRLFSLSRKPFPVNNYPFFYGDRNHCLDYSYMNVNHQPLTHFHGDHDPNLLMTARTSSDEGVTIKNQEGESNNFERFPATLIGAQDQQSRIEVLHEDIISMGYGNGVGMLYANSRIGTEEPNSWIGVPPLYGIPWESGMEDFGDLYRNHQYNPKLT